MTTPTHRDTDTPRPGGAEAIEELVKDATTHAPPGFTLAEVADLLALRGVRVVTEERR